jgi:hypothetical protein
MTENGPGRDNSFLPRRAQRTFPYRYQRTPDGWKFTNYRAGAPGSRAPSRSYVADGRITGPPPNVAPRARARFEARPGGGVHDGHRRLLARAHGSAVSGL